MLLFKLNISLYKKDATTTLLSLQLYLQSGQLHYSSICQTDGVDFHTMQTFRKDGAKKKHPSI